MQIKKTRGVLRREVLARRDKLSGEERQRKSELVMARLCELAPFAQAEMVFTYINFRSEVETMPLVRQCLKAGRKISVPVTMREESRLVACRITDPDRELHTGYCNIPEPDPATAAVINPQEIEVVLLPGSVFDRRGGRLGYGGGFYDRFLEYEAPKAVRIGLAFELQVVENLPLMPHDKLLHYLVTEDEVLEFI